MTRVTEHAFAKLNLVLHVGRPRPGGLHPLCSIFASIDLADELHAEPNGLSADRVECPGVAPEDNLAGAALAAFRERVPSLPPIGVQIVKRIPVAAGLGGGSADAAAALRAANRIAGKPLAAAALRELASGLGSDVPSQIEPRHALVGGVGEIVEPVELPPLGVVARTSRTGPVGRRGLRAARSHRGLARPARPGAAQGARLSHPRRARRAGRRA